MIAGSTILSSSFRDPSGFIFFQNKTLYRQINHVYKDNYSILINSGLYKALTSEKLLIPHKEIDEIKTGFKVIKPEMIPFISYPYEWSFSQLKNAALTTLKIQKIAVEYGMSLKDSSAYNIQFHKGKPIFIDTLSFERYKKGQPWIAYKQFCQHFFAPLVLMSKKDIRLNQLLRIHIDGIPLDLANSIIPFSFRPSILTHIKLHAKSQKRYANEAIKPDKHKMSHLSFLGLIDNLETSIKKLHWKPKDTEWADYYNDTNYSAKATCHKKEVLSKYLDKISPKIVWDLGANLGIFSRISSDRGINTISFDIDPAAVEKNYLVCVEKKEKNILPLLLDLANPSPGIGWGNKERDSFLKRNNANAVFALALIHHLSISNNLPFNKTASFFKKICRYLIIEFVPKNDSQVKRLLSSREDIFPDYNKAFFEKEYGEYFDILQKIPIKESERILYLMVKKK